MAISCMETSSYKILSHESKVLMYVHSVTAIFIKTGYDTIGIMREASVFSSW